MKNYLLIFISSTLFLSASSPYNKGREAYEKKEYFDALKYFYVSARNHNVNAYVELAIMYENGIGTQANSMSALYWYQKASKRGNLYAKKQLSTLSATTVWSVDEEDNKTSIWYWSELWSEDNSTKEIEEDDNSSIWSSMNFWSDDNKSSMWSRIKNWSMDDNISKTKDITQKPTSREILIDKEEW